MNQIVCHALNLKSIKSRHRFVYEGIGRWQGQVGAAVLAAPRSLFGEISFACVYFVWVTESNASHR